MFKMKKILVPTDFSTHAAAALEHAVEFGSRYEAEITLLHVDEFAVSPLGARGVSADYITTYQRRKQEFLEEELAALGRKFNTDSVKITPQIVQGRSYKAIIEEAEYQEYDLVVNATRGLTGLSSYLIGSTAERVVRLSRQPVLSVQEPPKAGGIVTSILCPTDLSPAGNVALSYALSLARQHKAQLFIQYISELEKPESEAEIRKRMPPLEEYHPMAGEVKVEYLFDRDVEPSNAIIRFADDADVSMIVMSTHGRKGLRRVYVGNNTAEVVRQSTRPVLTATHPLHKAVFHHLATERLEAFPIGESSDMSTDTKRRNT